MKDLNDHRIRMAVFEWLEECVRVHGSTLPWSVLKNGASLEDERIQVISQNGIFKPRQLELPISIRTSVSGPYEDGFVGERLHYKYRGTDPDHFDNTRLREVRRRRLPLVYFHGVLPGKYVVSWPVYIVGDRPEALTFEVVVDDPRMISLEEGVGVAEGSSAARRRYITSTTKRRVHQQAFRERVLAAYREQCALCSLKHVSLLEAAHIIPDSHPDGEPVVSNGLSLCKIHHAAFDKQILGIRPDYVAEIREDVLREVDGPMLRHGLQEMHGRRISVPRRADLKPDPEALEMRWQEFRSV